MIDSIQFPSGLSAELREGSFNITGIPWPAWTIPDALVVIAHLCSYSLAVTWLYSVTKTPEDSWTHYATKNGDYYSKYDPSIEAEENWGDFVERTCSEATDFLLGFELSSPIITPPPFRFGFVLMWESEDALTELQGQRRTRELANRPVLSLEDEVAQFRIWAAPQISDGEHSCWEVDYPNWFQVKQVFSEFLQKKPFRSWNSQTISDVLYIIARDNDSLSLAHLVAEEPERLLFLAQESIKSLERDAKWQFAVEMSFLDRQQYPIEPLLLAMFKDEDEYVRRQALMALGKIKSPVAENSAIVAWETGDQYQRMAALQVFFDMQSPQLASYVDKAKQDDSQYLSAYAARLLKNKY